jgi:hypothetical protein
VQANEAFKTSFVKKVEFFLLTPRRKSKCIASLIIFITDVGEVLTLPTAVLPQERAWVHMEREPV